jgi:hypothetical protein
MLRDEGYFHLINDQVSALPVASFLEAAKASFNLPTNEKPYCPTRIALPASSQRKPQPLAYSISTSAVVPSYL